MTPTDVGEGVLVPQPKAIRDLEDFARLALQLTPALKEALAAGATLSLEARGAGAIRLYSTPSGGAETRYLTEEAFAVSLVMDEATNLALPAATAADGALVWTGLERLIVPADWENGRLRFLWEGVMSGACVLTLKLVQPGGGEVVAEPVHLSLRSVRDFFQRVRATPEDGFPPPWDSNGPLPSMGWEVVHLRTIPAPVEADVDLVWVHGWRLAEWERQNWGEMMFKRLWHAGFKGRLHAFTWPTLSADDPFFQVGPEGKLSFDRSEHRAWKSGTALDSFLRSLRAARPASRRAVVAHSMGNVVAGEALRRGAPADLQIMLQAALPAGCYDPRSVLDEAELLQQDAKKPTPDHASDLGYRGYLSPVSVPTVNFFNEVDFALQSARVAGVDVSWIKNQLTKPDNPLGRGEYAYHKQVAGFYSGKKLLRELTDIHESLAFLARSRTRAAGAQRFTGFTAAGAPTGAAIRDRLDLHAAPYQFTDDRLEHSAQFNRPIQRRLMPFYTEIRRLVSP